MDSARRIQKTGRTRGKTHVVSNVDQVIPVPARDRMEELSDGRKESVCICECVTLSKVGPTRTGGLMIPSLPLLDVSELVSPLLGEDEHREVLGLRGQMFSSKGQVYVCLW